MSENVINCRRFLLLEHLTNPVIAAIGIGTISAAVMSSADSSILSSSSMFSRNFYKMTLRPNASDKELLYSTFLKMIVLSRKMTELGRKMTELGRKLSFSVIKLLQLYKSTH